MPEAASVDIDRASIPRLRRRTCLEPGPAGAPGRRCRRQLRHDPRPEPLRLRQARFTTLRRAYFLGDRLVREEEVARRRANPVQAGSLDERLMKLALPPSGHEPSATS
jgi:hypothetical protein